MRQQTVRKAKLLPAPLCDFSTAREALFIVFVVEVVKVQGVDEIGKGA